jgi:hypothetical protein
VKHYYFRPKNLALAGMDTDEPVTVSISANENGVLSFGCNLDLHEIG